MPGLSSGTKFFGGPDRRHAGTGARSRRLHEPSSSAGHLSRRETEVLHWLAEGKSGPEIAVILGISTFTVRIHIQGVKRKLNAMNIPHAVYLAVELGILRP